MEHAKAVPLLNLPAPRSTTKGRLSLSAAAGLALLSLAGASAAAERRELPVYGQVLEFSIPPGYSEPAAGYGYAVKESGGKRYALSLFPHAYPPGTAPVDDLRKLAYLPARNLVEKGPSGMSECVSAPTLRTRTSSPPGGSAFELLYWCPSSAATPGTSFALAMRTSAVKASSPDGHIRTNQVVLTVDGPESKAPSGPEAAAAAEAALAEAAREMDAFAFSSRQFEIVWTAEIRKDPEAEAPEKPSSKDWRAVVETLAAKAVAIFVFLRDH